jgi:cyclic beta-1,2-glucan synthetase
MQPRVGINLDISYKTLFTKIFAGDGGIDSYTNAISDIYQDNFSEGIFTGKGIYDLNVFSEVLSGKIPENTVLSHDLLEGCYLRCALVSDVLLMDGYPSKYNSFMNRLSRWIRGDWQIIKWLKSKLNLISKYKIFDNLRRSILEIFTMLNIIFFIILEEFYGIKTGKLIFLMFVIIILPFLLEILNNIIFKRGGEKTQETYTPKIAGVKGAIYRGIITLGCMPYKAIVSQIAIAKTLHRMTVTHKNLLEWTTSEEAEKMGKTDLASYYKTMCSSFILGILAIIVSIQIKNFLLAVVGILWVVTPFVMWQISKEQLKKYAIDYLNKNDKNYIIDVAKRTWDFFYTYLNEKNNYLIPDNYQENRKNKIVLRTSSTNIGLSLLTVISAYNLGFIKKEEANYLLEKIIDTIESLQKWNGHLYNWYDIRTKMPLNPKYVSTVDSGNFV